MDNKENAFQICSAYCNVCRKYISYIQHDFVPDSLKLETKKFLNSKILKKIFFSIFTKSHVQECRTYLERNFYYLMPIKTYST